MFSFRGVQFEVLVSLTVVMVAATAVLAAFMMRTHMSQIETLRDVIGRALLIETEAPTFPLLGGAEGVEWWRSDGDAFRPLGGHTGVPTAALLDLAQTARREGTAVVGVGSPWEPLRFAAPLGATNDVALGRVPPAMSGGIVIAMLAMDCIVFITMGATLLRSRVVAPMREMAAATREVGEGSRGTRVRVEGNAEAAEVATAFNDMAEALEQRSDELERAVSDLRETNRTLRHARDGLDRSERLAAVGSLAAGVAHEVGNPMGALLAFLDLAQRDEDVSQDTRAYLSRASEQGGRVRDILRQLLDFSKPPRGVRGPLDLAAAAEQTKSLVTAQSRYDAIEIELIREDNLPAVIADDGMVTQVLLNLILNAADAALDGTGPPCIRIALRAAPLETRHGEDGGGSAGREYLDAVECAVADSGCGVAEANRERIFDPFFTTKDPGVGTGLGLANVLQFAQDMNGVVELSEESPLSGAEFVFRLPTDAPVARKVRGDAERA